MKKVFMKIGQVLLIAFITIQPLLPVHAVETSKQQEELVENVEKIAETSNENKDDQKTVLNEEVEDIDENALEVITGDNDTKNDEDIVQGTANSFVDSGRMESRASSTWIISDGNVTRVENITISISETVILVEGGGQLLVGSNGSLVLDKSTLTVKNGGSITIQAGATIVIKDGSSISLEDGANLIIEEGATFTLEEGATIQQGDYAYTIKKHGEADENGEVIISGFSKKAEEEGLTTVAPPNDSIMINEKKYDIVSIDSYAFTGKNLSSIDLSRLTALTSIGRETFENNLITELDLSDLTSLESIGIDAFANNINLTQITLGKYLVFPTVEWDIFLGCPNLKYIILTEDEALSVGTRVLIKMAVEPANGTVFVPKDATIGDLPDEVQNKIIYPKHFEFEKTATATDWREAWLAAMVADGTDAVSLSFTVENDSDVSYGEHTIDVRLSVDGTDQELIIPITLTVKAGIGATFVDGDYEYEVLPKDNIDANDTVSMIGFSQTAKDSGKKTVDPQSSTAEHGGKSYDIVSIAQDAFSNKSITSINLSELKKLTIIGEGSFSNNQIKKVNLNDLSELVTINRCAFQFNEIGELKLDGLEKLTKISDYTFYRNRLKKVELIGLKKLTIIDDAAFEGDYNDYNQIHTLTVSNLGELTRIGDRAFKYNKIKNLNINGLTSLKSIGHSAFYSNKITTLDLSNLGALENIGNYAFYSNEITTLDLSDLGALETIGNSAFASNKINELNISELTLLSSIGTKAFYNNEIPTLDLSDLAALTTIGEAAFASNEITTLDLSGLDVLTMIGEDAFYNNKITTLDLSDLDVLTTIGEAAFGNNDSLTQITLGKHPNLDAANIGDNIFVNCPNLKYVILTDDENALSSGTKNLIQEATDVASGIVFIPENDKEIAESLAGIINKIIYPTAVKINKNATKDDWDKEWIKKMVLSDGIANFSLKVTNNIATELDDIGKAVQVELIATLDSVETTLRMPITMKVYQRSEGIALDKTAITMQADTSEKITETINPVETENKTVTWTSSDTDIAMVDINGNVTAVDNGTATITAKANDNVTLTADCIVTVATKTESIQIKNIPTAMKIGDTTTLTAEVLPAKTEDKTVIWTSSAPAIVSIDATGKIKAKDNGTAKITATANDGSGIKTECTITVSTKTENIQIKNIPTTMKIGDTTTLTTEVLPVNAEDKTVIWTSSAPAIVSIDATGKIEAKDNGTATIKATANDGSDIEAECTITVSTKAESITINEVPASLEINTTTQLRATVHPVTTENKIVAWTSEDPTVATVDTNGNIQPVSNGTTTVKATTTDGTNLTTNCTITVFTIATGLSITPNKQSLTVGDTPELRAAFTPATTSNTNLVWTSSDEAVATVNEQGIVTARMQGTALITAKTQDGSDLAATCEITVESLTLTIEIEKSVLEVGQTVTLEANQNINWTFDETLFEQQPNVATRRMQTVFDNKLTLKAIKAADKAIITANSLDGQEQKMEITIKDAPQDKPKDPAQPTNPDVPTHPGAGESINERYTLGFLLLIAGVYIVKRKKMTTR